MDGHLLIQNATLILPDRVVEGDLRVSGGSISTIAPGGGLDAGSLWTPRDNPYRFVYKSESGSVKHRSGSFSRSPLCSCHQP